MLSEKPRKIRRSIKSMRSVSPANAYVIWAELLANLGHTSVKPRIKALKSLQDELGDWHDRHVLLQFIAEFIGRPEFLVSHPDTGRVLLAEMERERRRNDAAVSNILKSAENTRDAWGESKAAVTEE